jgi:hypothetical protein
MKSLFLEETGGMKARVLGREGPEVGCQKSDAILHVNLLIDNDDPALAYFLEKPHITRFCTLLSHTIQITHRL